MTNAASSQVRDRLLDTASRLFYREGLRATGIDRIIAESGVAKMSFYRHFPSKTDLIVAFLEKRHIEWMAWFRETSEKKMAGRGKNLKVIAEVLGVWFSDPDYRGCAFINAVAEGGVSVDAVIRSVSVQHKQDLQRYVERLAKQLDLNSPRVAAKEAMLVVEGMIVRFQMTGDTAVVKSGATLLAAIDQLHRRGAP